MMFTSYTAYTRLMSKFNCPVKHSWFLDFEGIIQRSRNQPECLLPEGMKQFVRNWEVYCNQGTRDLTWKTYNTGLSSQLGWAKCMVPWRAYCPLKSYDLDLHYLSLLSTFPSSRFYKTSWLRSLSSFLISSAFFSESTFPGPLQQQNPLWVPFLFFLLCCCYYIMQSKATQVMNMLIWLLTLFHNSSLWHLRIDNKANK